ncbi:MAG: methyltransferase domain-containing protein [Pseudomonadota bacterium]
MSEDTSPFVELFNDPEHAERYAEGPAQFMPGYADVQRMTSVLIGLRTSPDAHVLVHGAGGGLELQTFASFNPGWSFTGVEPAKPMLEEAVQRIGSLNERVAFHHGFIDDAPEGPFDAATSLLTLHFLDAEARKSTIAEIVLRLKPGAPFVAVHCSFSEDPEIRDPLLIRHREFAIAGGADPELAEQGRASIAEDLPVLDPSVDFRLLREAGLTDVSEFYSAFTWRGWVGYAP